MVCVYGFYGPFHVCFTFWGEKALVFVRWVVSDFLKGFILQEIVWIEIIWQEKKITEKGKGGEGVLTVQCTFTAQRPYRPPPFHICIVTDVDKFNIQRDQLKFIFPGCFVEVLYKLELRFVENC